MVYVRSKQAVGLRLLNQLHGIMGITFSFTFPFKFQQYKEYQVDLVSATRAVGAIVLM